MIKKVAFLHPDLGIGGAERAIIDAAIALRNKNYDITIFTNHHDKTHCFEETINGDLNVVVIADFLPRSFFGIFSAFFAYFRFFMIALYMILFDNKFDLLYIDQISAPIPLLKIFKFKVLFYAHYPDMLLSQPGGLAKRFYRFIINNSEWLSLKYADQILYNSVFTSEVFREYFDYLKKIDPIILYPVPNITNLSSTNKNDHPFIDPSFNNTKIFLSINRYERKKNIELALNAFAIMDRAIGGSGASVETLFVHAGGHDDRVEENKAVFASLSEMADKLGIKHKVTFLKSCSNSMKVNLLKRATALLYTPSNEHFGIVPIEAMYLRCPVIAVNSGGPLETVLNTVTGFLCEPQPEIFAEAMHKLAVNDYLSTSMGDAGHERVLRHFSFEVFQQRLDAIVCDLIRS